MQSRNIQKNKYRRRENLNLDDFIVSEGQLIIEVIRIIDNNTKGIVFVCKDKRTLLGVVTDGDIRRYILNQGNLYESISKIMNYSPKYIKNRINYDYTDYMKKNHITAVPIVTNDIKIVAIQFLYDNAVVCNASLDVPVVIMAGGKGTRLYPYTQILPKPLIPIGEKTITELIMERFETFGCTHFDMIVNYKKNFIKSFFMDHENQRNIDFIEENEFLGTGGGLKLLEEKYKNSFFLSNCDIIVDEDYSEIYEYHKREHNLITMVAAKKKVVIPYGTIDMSKNGQVKRINEKPNFDFLTNTGLYIIEPEFIKSIPDNTFIHITDLIQECVDRGEKVGVYTINEESWMDMGQLDELDKMRERLGNDAIL